MSVYVLCLVSTRLITHAKQLLEDNEEALCVRVLQTIKGMMARDIDFGDKVSRKNISPFLHLMVPFWCWLSQGSYFGERSQKTSKCGKNISDTLDYRLVCHFFVLTTF